MTKKQPPLLQAIDDLVETCDPAARGILQCLGMLADEADMLGLTDTRNALKRAMRNCAAESRDQRKSPPAAPKIAPPGTVLH